MSCGKQKRGLARWGRRRQPDTRGASAASDSSFSPIRSLCLCSNAEDSAPPPSSPLPPAGPTAAPACRVPQTPRAARRCVRVCVWGGGIDGRVSGGAHRPAVQDKSRRLHLCKPAAHSDQRPLHPPAGGEREERLVARRHVPRQHRLGHRRARPLLVLRGLEAGDACMSDTGAQLLDYGFAHPAFHRATPVSMRLRHHQPPAAHRAPDLVGLLVDVPDVELRRVGVRHQHLGVLRQLADLVDLLSGVGWVGMGRGWRQTRSRQERRER